ncbi:protein containing Cadherin domain protein [Rhodopirellula baltica SWK14]|uniref:Protein containing Cadherin domain protein n=2 Tax=Rhodopirellula baltica TaxID=265606 RepID=L7C943_RHOBT|nr:protein containing Cadherin domain protein [Rhodopirellula baltica SWK14]
MQEISLNVTGENDAPVAADDSVIVNQNSNVAFAVLGNDSDIDGDSLIVNEVNGTPIADGAAGVAVSDGTVDFDLAGSFTFTPTPGFSGTTSFDYTVSDGNGGMDTATVSIAVIGPGAANNPPVAEDDTYGTLEDIAVNGNVLDGTGSGGTADSDLDGDPLLAILLSAPTNGSVSLLGDGSFTYTPTANFEGPTDSFTYRVVDGQGGSDDGLVTVNVTPVNDLPVLGDASFGIAEDASIADPIGQVTATDVDGTIASYSITAGNTGSAFAIDGSGNITVNGPLDFETASTYSLSVLATDDDGATDLATVTVNVGDVNDAPVVPDLQAFTVAENTAGGTVVGTILATDEDAGQSLSYSLAGAGVSDFTIDPSSGVVSVAPAADLDFETAPSSYNLTVTVTDNGTPTESTSATVTINLSDVVDEVGPRINAVRVNSTTWTDLFRDFVDYDEDSTPDFLRTNHFNDGEAAGYEIPFGSEQATTLTWLGLNEILVDFDEDVFGVDADDFQIDGVAGVNADSTPGAIPSIINVQYDASARRATITLNQAVQAAAVNVTVLSDGIWDASGNPLDGEWTNDVEPASGKSGNGIAGGDFEFRLNVLPGDVDKGSGTVNGAVFDNVVNTSDENAIEDPSVINAQLFDGTSRAAAPNYDATFDLNGNGLVSTVFDVPAVESRIGSYLFQPVSTMSLMLAGSFASNPASQELGNEDEALLQFQDEVDSKQLKTVSADWSHPEGADRGEQLIETLASQEVDVESEADAKDQLLSSGEWDFAPKDLHDA